MSEICLVCSADSIVKLCLYVIEFQTILIDYEATAVRKSADAQAASCTRRNLVPVLCDDIYQRPSYGTETSDEEVDVLSASSVKEFVVDCLDRSICIIRR